MVLNFFAWILDNKLISLFLFDIYFILISAINSKRNTLLYYILELEQANKEIEEYKMMEESKGEQKEELENKDSEKQKEDIKQSSDILKGYYLSKHGYEVSINFNIKTTILRI